MISLNLGTSVVYVRRRFDFGRGGVFSLKTMLVAKNATVAGSGGGFTAHGVVSSFLPGLALLLTIGGVLLPNPRPSTG
jgi:hypothetical protein